MVAYHPDQRYQTIDEVIDACERLIYRRRKKTGMLDHPAPDPQIPFEPLGPSEIEDDLSVQQTTVFTGPVTTPPPTGATGFQRRRSARKRRRRRREERDEPEDRITWSIQTNDEVRATARWDGDRVTIGSYDSYLYAIDPAKGSTTWKFPTGNGVVARAARDGELYIVGSEDGSSLRNRRIVGRAALVLPHRSRRSLVRHRARRRRLRRIGRWIRLRTGDDSG